MSRPAAHAILPAELENRTAQAPGRRRTEGRPDTRYRLRLRIAEPAGKGRHLESRKLLIVSNTETVPGKKIVEFYGVVTGSTVRAKHIGKDILAGVEEYRRRRAERLHRVIERSSPRGNAANDRGGPAVGGERRGQRSLLDEFRRPGRGGTVCLRNRRSSGIAMGLEGFDQLVVYVGSICVFLLLGALVGTRLEREHYRRIREREARTRDFPVMTLQTLPQDWSVEACCLVTGSVVISLDYFKRFLARLRMLVGGRLRSYEPLLDRAHREALLRLKEEAALRGYHAVCGVRLETSRLANANGNGTAGVEILAFGTAVKLSGNP